MAVQAGMVVEIITNEAIKNHPFNKKAAAELVILQRTARSLGVAKPFSVSRKLSTPREPAN